MSETSRLLQAALLAVLCTGTIHASETVAVGFDAERWEIQQGEVTEYLGRECFKGRAVLKEIELADGVIEVDMAFEGPRSFVGILFRMESDRDYENVYLRPHKSDKPDALQYTPVFNGSSGWQLYNGEGFTAQATIPHEQWIRIRLEFSGSRARLFLDGAEQPALVIDELKRGAGKGRIGVAGPPNGLGYFADFKYRVDDELDFGDPPEVEPAAGMLTDWEISRPFHLYEVDYEHHPAEQGLAELGWQAAEAEADGLINISRMTAKPGPEPSAIFARTTLRAEKDEIRELNFGYSDALVIFLNGRRLFSGTSTFRSRDATFLGAVGLFDSVDLPLRKGDNELLFTVLEAFGGWGFMAQDGSRVIRGEGLQELWSVSRGLNMPESAVYDRERDVLYVSCFGQYSPPGRQSIAKVRPDGGMVEPDWVGGLARPTGEIIHGDKLYVVERRGLAEIELETGTIAGRHPFPGPVFPNDVALDGSGNLYVSDSGRGVIYRFRDGEMEVWLEGEEVSQPNGMLVHAGGLVWGNNGDNDLKRVDLATKQVRTIAHLGPGIIDGIKPDRHGNYLVSHFNGRLYRVTPEGEVSRLLDTTARGIRLADFEYVPDKQLLVIPTLQNNKLLGYRFED